MWVNERMEEHRLVTRTPWPAGGALVTASLVPALWSGHGHFLIGRGLKWTRSLRAPVPGPLERSCNTLNTKRTYKTNNFKCPFFHTVWHQNKIQNDSVYNLNPLENIRYRCSRALIGYFRLIPNSMRLCVADGVDLNHITEGWRAKKNVFVKKLFPDKCSRGWDLCLCVYLCEINEVW